MLKFKQKTIVRTKQNFEIFNKIKKKVLPFWQSVHAILKDVSVTETTVS